MLNARRKSSTSGLTPSPQNAADFQPVGLSPLDERVLSCAFGHYPWDDWERHALASGLDADLAGLGRLLIREAFNHSWEAWLQHRCGWGDDGAALLALALRAPKSARRQWEILMRTDGLRRKEWNGVGCSQSRKPTCCGPLYREGNQ
jgi:hypothetical protein